MKSFWNLTAVAFVSAAMIGCGESAPPPAPPPTISLGDSSTAAESPAGNTEPEAKTEPEANKEEAEQPKSEDKPKNDGAAKTETPKAADNEVALAAAAPKSDGKFDPTAETLKIIKTMKVKPGDWPQWGGSYFRNNVPEGKGIATEWDVDPIV